MFSYSLWCSKNTVLKSTLTKSIPFVKKLSFKVDILGAKKYFCFAFEPNFIIAFIKAGERSLSKAELAL